MSINDLLDFEQEIKRIYSCEVEFEHLMGMQEIIDRGRFNLTDLCNFFKGCGTIAGPKEGMIKGNPCFYSNALTAGYMVEWGGKKLRYVYCEDTRSTPTMLYVFGFPASIENTYYQYLCKIEKLKAFL